MTPRERAFVYRAWEDKIVRESQLTHDAFMLAYCNANRKKGRRVQPLWQKNGGKVDTAEMQRLVQEQKKTNIKGLLDKIRRR